MNHWLGCTAQTDKHIWYSVDMGWLAKWFLSWAHNLLLHFTSIQNHHHHLRMVIRNQSFLTSPFTFSLPWHKSTSNLPHYFRRQRGIELHVHKYLTVIRTQSLRKASLHFSYVQNHQVKRKCGGRVHTHCVTNNVGGNKEKKIANVQKTVQKLNFPSSYLDQQHLLDESL